MGRINGFLGETKLDSRWFSKKFFYEREAMRKRDPLPMRFQKKIMRIDLRDAPHRSVVFVDPLNALMGLKLV